MPTSSTHKSAPSCIAQVCTFRSRTSYPFACAKRRACASHTRAKMRVPFLRDAKMRAQDAVIGIARLGLPLFSQLPVFLASFFCTIRDKQEGGAAIKRLL